MRGKVTGKEAGKRESIEVLTRDVRRRSTEPELRTERGGKSSVKDTRNRLTIEKCASTETDCMAEAGKKGRSVKRESTKYKGNTDRSNN